MNNQDFRTDLEKSIDYVNQDYCKKTPYYKEYVENGQISVLRAAYGLKFDHCEQRVCFRSARKDETSSTIGDSYFFQKRKFSNQTNIANFLKEMMEGIREAVNNTDIKNNYKSYSKYLAAPLFKYSSKNSCLMINRMLTNTIDATIEIHCFDWIDSFDENGDKKNRYHAEYYETIIPVKELTSKKQLLNKTNDFIEDEVGWKSDYMDIDNIILEIKNLTIDISESSRNCFDKYYNEHWQKWFKRHASYKKDKEIITTKDFYEMEGYCIQNHLVLQFVRFIYILKISKCYSEKVETFVFDVLKNKYSESLLIDENDIRGVIWILEYLKIEEIVNRERSNYIDTFDDYTTNKYFRYRKDSQCEAVGLLKRLCKDKCFEEKFLNWLLTMTQFENFSD